MNKLLSAVVLALLPAAPSFAEPYIRLVPVAPQGLTAPPYSDVLISGDAVYVGSPPQRLWFEIRLGGWGDVETNPGVFCRLRYVPAVLDRTTWVNGLGGALTAAMVTCNADHAVCENELGPALIATDHGCAVMNDTLCSAALVNPARRDMFHDMHTCFNGTTFLSCVSRANAPAGSIVDDGGDHYLGTIVVDVPADARGEYVLDFDHAQTQFSCHNFFPGVFSEMRPAVIRICQPDECIEKNRYVTLSPTTLPLSAPSGGGIRMRLVQVNAHLVTDPPPQWVGVPQAYTDPASGQTYFAAELSCTPSIFNWASLPPDALLHVYGANVVPNARYEIRAGDGFCVGDPDEWDICLSPPTFQRTAAYGDVIEPFGGPGQPNFLDISALVHAFKVLPTAVLKPRAQLAGTVPNPAGAVSFLDIAAGVSAFKGESFPFAGVVYCP